MKIRNDNLKPLLVTGLSAIVLSAVAGPRDAQSPDPALDDRAIVRLQPGYDIADFNAQFGTTVIDSIPTRNIHHLDLPDDVIDPHAWAEAIALNPPQGLAWIEADYDGQDGEGRTGSFYVSDINGHISYQNQFPRTQQDLPVVHLLTTGQNTTVAVLDTGIALSHELFAGRIAAGGYNFVDDNTNVDDVRDFVDNDADGVFDESWGHGTFVSGLILMMAPDAMILPIKVLNSDGHANAWVIGKGLFHAVDQGVDVINGSFGSTYNSEIVEDAIEEGKRAGVVIVAAVGNRNLDSGSGDEEVRELASEYPALKSSVIAVTSLDDNDVKSDFSNYGEPMHRGISAPGSGGMWSAIPMNDDGHTYAEWRGTSFATGVVSGATAALLAYHPEWPRTEAREALTRDSFGETAVDVDVQNPNYVNQLGMGRLNLQEALDAQVDEAYVTSFEVVTGTHLGGDLESLEKDDQDYLRVRSGFGQQLSELHKSEVVVEGITTLDSIQGLDLEIEQRTDQPSAVSRVSLYRWSTNSWVQVFQRNVGATDQFDVVSIVNPSQYFDGDGRIRVRLKHTVFVPFLAFRFESFYDRMKIEVE